MKNISDIIEEHLKRSLQQSPSGVLELQRSELAQHFQCVPSQINYVISTRFTLEHGFIVESKRGGGGYIRIRKAELPENVKALYAHFAKRIGEQISQSAAEALLVHLTEVEPLTERELAILRSVVSRELYPLPLPLRDVVRANVLRSVLHSLFREGGDKCGL